METCLVLSVVLAALYPGAVRSDSVHPEKAHVTAAEGDATTLRCHYNTSSSGSYYVYWYRQHPNQTLQYILRRGTKTVSGIRDNAPFAKERFSSEAGDSDTTLNISSVELADTAVYDCALQGYGGGNTQLIFGKGTKLSVKPNLQDSDPSIYKLKSPETHISACLITDYFPDNIRISNKEKNESFQSSIIEVRNPESNKKEASYGGVHWFESDFDGYVNHSLHFTSKCPEDTEDEEDTCITMKMSDNFETDEHLNLMSFMVLGMKVIFLKGVAFNLIVTFIAWRS